MNREAHLFAELTNRLLRLRPIGLALRARLRQLAKRKRDSAQP
jgi:hypothetical protein